MDAITEATGGVFVIETAGEPLEVQAHEGTWAALLHAAHANHSNAIALLTPKGALTYAEVLAAAAKVAASLTALGVPRGARIVLALDNRPEMVVVERALALWGWTRVAVSPRLHPEEVDYIAQDCQASVVICEAHIAAASKAGALIVSAEPHPAASRDLGLLMDSEHAVPPYARIGPDELASLMYTSGTTGRPKGAMNTHRAWFAMAKHMQDLLPSAGPGDVLLHAAPMGHFSGSVAAAYAIGGAAIATIRKFDPDAVLDEARRIGATCIPLVPTMLLDLIRGHRERPLLPKLRVLPYGGSSIAPDTLIRARHLLGDVLLQVYGMSEALIPVTSLSIADHRSGADEDRRLATAGVPHPGVSIRLNDLVEGVGEICVRGSNVMTGYWGNPDQTREVLDSEGWYATGDLGVQDSVGRIQIVGRKRDLVISGGFNVYPAEVERVIAAAPGIAEVAVIGVPHARWGEAVVAIVVRELGAAVNAEDILQLCRSHLAGYKKPSAIRFVPELPKMSTGKLDKNRIREDYLQAQEAAVRRGLDAS
jgi:acyl-CoA synthetase (AMP-forming)/AMP-acid ligase II